MAVRKEVTVEKDLSVQEALSNALNSGRDFDLAMLAITSAVFAGEVTEKAGAVAAKLTCNILRRADMQLRNGGGSEIAILK